MPVPSQLVLTFPDFPLYMSVRVHAAICAECFVCYSNVCKCSLIAGYDIPRVRQEKPHR